MSQTIISQKGVELQAYTKIAVYVTYVNPSNIVSYHCDIERSNKMLPMDITHILFFITR